MVGAAAVFGDVAVKEGAVGFGHHAGHLPADLIQHGGGGVGHRRGGGEGQVGDGDGAVAARLAAAHHVEVEGGAHLLCAVAQTVEPGVGAGELGHQQHADAPAEGRQDAALQQVAEGLHGLHDAGRAAGVVVGRGTGMAQVAQQQDLLVGLAGQEGGDVFQRTVVEAGIDIAADLGTLSFGGQLLAEQRQPVALPGRKDEAEGLLLARLPPEGGVAQGIRLVVALADVGILQDIVGDEAGGALFLHGPVVDLIDIVPDEDDLARKVEVPVGGGVGALVQQDHLGGGIAQVAGGAFLNDRDGAGVEIGQTAAVGRHQVAPGAVAVPLLKRGIGAEDDVLPGREGKHFGPRHPHAPELVPAVQGGGAVAGGGLDAVIGGYFGHRLQGARTADVAQDLLGVFADHNVTSCMWFSDAVFSIVWDRQKKSNKEGNF